MRVPHADGWRRAVEWIDGNTESLNETVDLIFSDNFANVLLEEPGGK